MISIIRSNASDKSEYIGQMLSLWGLACWQIVEPQQLKSENSSVVLVPDDAAVSAELVKSCLDSGKHVILITPDRSLFDGLGFEYSAYYCDDKKLSYLRLAKPSLSVFSHYSLPIIGNRISSNLQHYRGNVSEIMPPENACITAYLYEKEGVCNDRPAIWSVPLEAGTLTVFAYDIAECFKLLRQGRPEYANWRPAFDDICRPGYLFGPNWTTEFHSQHLPLADFHPMLLIRVIEDNIKFPVPRFWQLPGSCHSAILVSGDEDSSPTECDEEEISFLDAIGGNITLYIHILVTKTPKEKLQEWMKKGHGFSVHPYPIFKGESESFPVGDHLDKIEKFIKEFQARYDISPRVIRNHRTFWTGYMDIPRLWEKLGVEMDTNYISAGLAERDFSGFYASPAAALPVCFLDEQNKMINVLQQPVCAIDGLEFDTGNKKDWSKKHSPQMFEMYCDALVTNVLKPLGIPFSFVFHPGNFCTFAKDHSQKFLYKATEKGTKLISDHQWLDFWQMRKGWQIVNCKNDGFMMSCKFEGKQETGQNLSITLPILHNGKELCEIIINGKKSQFDKITHFGESRALVNLPDKTINVELKSKYCLI